MAKIINCECGYVVQGTGDEELVANLTEHIRTDHPELAGKVDPHDMLAMAEEI